MKCDRQVMRAFGPRRSGLTMVEAVVSIAIVGVMMVAALNTVGASRLGQKKTGDRGRGTLLAQALMAEILRHVYEPAAFPDSFGRLASEPAGGPRNLWDDVDDYDNWSASPPQNEDGSVIPNLAGWRRSVDVDRVNPANLGQTVGSDQDVKRIVVTVKRDGVPVASLTAVRTASGPIDR